MRFQMFIRAFIQIYIVTLQSSRFRKPRRLGQIYDFKLMIQDFMCAYVRRKR